MFSLANKITAFVKKKPLVQYLQLDPANSNSVISNSPLFPVYLGFVLQPFTIGCFELLLITSNYFSFPLRGLTVVLETPVEVWENEGCCGEMQRLNNELRNQITHQCFSFVSAFYSSDLFSSIESNEILRNQQDCFQLKFLSNRSVELISMIQCFRTRRSKLFDSAKNDQKN